MLYLEERYHQIDPAEYQPEVHSLRFFGAGAESAAIEVLALIDWATEFLELSRSPVPEIPAFLRRPFVVGKRVQFPIPEDPRGCDIQGEMHPHQGPEGMGVSLRAPAVLDRSGDEGVQRNTVWGMVPAR